MWDFGRISFLNKKAFTQDMSDGLMSVEGGGGILYSEVQCIMGNGYMGALIHYEHADTSENITFPQLHWRAVKWSSSYLEPWIMTGLPSCVRALGVWCVVCGLCLLWGPYIGNNFFFPPKFVSRLSCASSGSGGGGGLRVPWYYLTLWK